MGLGGSVVGSSSHPASRTTSVVAAAPLALTNWVETDRNGIVGSPSQIVLAILGRTFEPESTRCDGSTDPASAVHRRCRSAVPVVGKVGKLGLPVMSSHLTSS